MDEKNYYIKGRFKSINLLVGENDSGRTEFLKHINKINNQRNIFVDKKNDNTQKGHNEYDNGELELFWTGYFGYKIIDLKLNQSQSLKQLFKLLNQFRDTEGNGLILVDEPEMHFHPNKHLKIAELIVSRVSLLGLNTFVITNSPFLVKAFQLMLFTNHIKLDELGTYYFDNKEQYIEIRELELNQEGQFLHKYPDDLFEIFHKLNRKFYS